MGATDTPDLVEQDKPLAGLGDASLERRREELSDGHPASDYAADQGRRLTDAEYAEHVTEVKEKLADAHAAGLATDVQHTVDEWHEVWSAERQIVHDEIVDDLYRRSAHVPCEYKAILAGGLPGSGKTTILHEHAGIDLSHYLMINPDEVKEEMALRELVPSIAGLSPMEASDLAHEESSYIAKRLANRAELDGKNVIWDITMSRTQSAIERIDSLRAAGYRDIDAIFVDIPPETSARRAESRHRGDNEAFRAGEGQGGRLRPRETILGFADPDWGSQNRKNFEELKPRFNAWSRYDNSVDGKAATLAERSTNDHHWTDRRTAE